MGLRDAACVVYVNGDVRLRAAQINRHAHGAFRVGDSLYPVDYILPAALEFALKLRHQRLAVLPIQIVKRTPRHDGDAGGNHSDRQQQRDRENPEELGAKRHCDSCSSQTSAKGQPSPAAGAFQFLTRAPKPYTRGSHTSGTTRQPFTIVRSRS